MNKKLIPALTDEMCATFPQWVDEWTAIGRSTEPVDCQAAIRGIGAAYAAAGLAPPVVFGGISPIGGAIIRHLIRARVGAGVGAGVWAGVGDGVRDGVRAGFWDGVWAGVGAGWHEDLIYGSHEAGWLSFYDWFRCHGLAETVAPLNGLTLLARSAGWCWVHRGFAVITDRPTIVNDERVAGIQHRRRLHCADGPSVAYRDGWALHHWHGQLVPAWVIDTPTPDRIQAEKNTEIRRCAIERFGWDRYLDALHVIPVDDCDDPGNPGHRLRLYDLPDSAQLYGARVRLVVMDNASLDRDGTRRTYAETVPADMPDAVTAQAWAFDVDPTIYRSLERAT